jgi:hypothetical protein
LIYLFLEYLNVHEFFQTLEKIFLAIIYNLYERIKISYYFKISEIYRNKKFKNNLSFTKQKSNNLKFLFEFGRAREKFFKQFILIYGNKNFCKSLNLLSLSLSQDSNI